jgi:hypothetical protein
VLHKIIFPDQGFQLSQAPSKSTRMNSYGQAPGQKWLRVKWFLSTNSAELEPRILQVCFVYVFVLFSKRNVSRITVYWAWHFRAFLRASTQQSYQETIIDYWSHLNEGEPHGLAIDTTSWTLAQSAIRSHTHTHTHTLICLRDVSEFLCLLFVVLLLWKWRFSAFYKLSEINQIAVVHFAYEGTVLSVKIRYLYCC